MFQSNSDRPPPISPSPLACECGHAHAVFSGVSVGIGEEPIDEMTASSVATVDHLRVLLDQIRTSGAAGRAVSISHGKIVGFNYAVCSIVLVG